MPAASKPLDGTAAPKYAQLESELRILAAALGPGAAIDSERALMDAYGVSRATVRKAIANLVHDGVLESAHGRGTFVAQARVQTHLHLASFTEDMRRRGRVPSTELLSVQRLDPPENVAAFFGTRAQAWRVERLRLADAEPMAYEIQWVNATLAPNLGSHDLRGSLYAVFDEAYGCPIDAAEQTLWAEPADSRLAQLLAIGTGDPALLFDRTSTSQGRPVELVRSWYRADRYRVHMNLDRSMPS